MKNNEVIEEMVDSEQNFTTANKSPKNVSILDSRYSNLINNSSESG